MMIIGQYVIGWEVISMQDDVMGCTYAMNVRCTYEVYVHRIAFHEHIYQ